MKRSLGHYKVSVLYRNSTLVTSVVAPSAVACELCAYFRVKWLEEDGYTVLFECCR